MIAGHAAQHAHKTVIVAKGLTAQRKTQQHELISVLVIIIVVRMGSGGIPHMVLGVVV